jgi:hypothetical protein
MSQGPQYTSCVAPKDFSPPDPLVIGVLIAVGGGSFLAILAGFGAWSYALIAVVVQALRYVLEFMLNGKLICLHRDPAQGCHCGAGGNTVCAIGEVCDTEQVGEDKNPVEDIDNDYSVNLILAPFDLKKFADNPGKSDFNVAANHALATAPSHPQGDLLRGQTEMPSEDGKTMFTGYFRTMVMTLLNGQYHAWTELFGREQSESEQKEAWADYLEQNAALVARKFETPVLHCEFEGSRIRDMLDVIDAFSLGGEWCKSNWFTRALCVILQTLFAPLALALVALAWATADDGSLEGALQGGGTIAAKDWVIVRGRWVYDGGHSGWNEVHATRIIQKVYNVPPGPAEFKKFLDDWCGRMSEVPHFDYPGVGPLEPPAQVTFDNQQKPENDWTMHPEVDGCEPEEEWEPPDIK